MNTVVSKYNKNEFLADFINELKPFRWKILQVARVEGQNDKQFEEVKVNSEEFQDFCEQNKQGLLPEIKFVVETNDIIRGSYLMIDMLGRFYDSSKGCHSYSKPILQIGVEEALKEIDVSYEKFTQREGNYSVIEETIKVKKIMKKMYNKISLSGLAGSGKSTVGKQLAKMLNYEFISVGNFSRESAMKEYGMNINEFQKYCEANPHIDQEIDSHFAEYCSQKANLIIDYRLAYYFIPDAFHVFLKVSEEVAFQRLQSSNDAQRVHEFGSQMLNLYQEMKQRNEDMRSRFLKTYQTDFTDVSHYDLVIDTNNLQPNQICNLILAKIQNL